MKLFGTTIKETIKAFRPLHLGRNRDAGKNKIKAIGFIIISVALILLTAYLYSIQQFTPASAVFGVVVGYIFRDIGSD